MLIPRIITRRPASTSVCSITLAALSIFCALAFIINVSSLAAPPSTSPASPSSQLSELHSRHFSLVRSWTNTFEPPSLSAPESAIDLPDTPAVGVLIRRSGRLLASAVDADPDPYMLRRALGRALNDSLGDPQVANLPRDMRDSLGSLLTIQVELAHAFTPLVGRTLEQMCENFQPGIHGLAVRRADRIAVIFPAQMLAVGSAENPSQNFIALGLSLDLSLKDLQSPASLENVSFYSFTCDSLAQSTPTSAPFYALRFVPLEPSPLTTSQSLISFSDNLINHLAKTISLDASAPPLGLNGSYNPVNDQFSPLFASPAEQALVALALARTAASRHLPAEITAKSLALSLAILHQLSIVQSPESDPLLDPAACAAITLAAHTHHSISSDPTLAAFFSSAANCVLRSFNPKLGFNDLANPVQPIPIRSAHTQSLIAYALVTLLRDQHPTLTSDLVRAALDAAWKSTPGNQSVAMLPWIGWAESDFASITRQPLAHADDLHQTLAAINAARIISSSIASSPQPPADVLAGLSLHSASAPSAARFLADAQTTRPAAWLTAAILDPALTPPNSRASASASALDTMSFIIRLSVTSSSQGLLPNFDRALGGIRAAPWSAEQPLPAQAMALLCAVESLDLFPQTPAHDQ